MHNVSIFLVVILLAFVLMFSRVNNITKYRKEVVKEADARIIEVEKEHAICFVYEGVFSSKPMNCIKKEGIK